MLPPPSQSSQKQQIRLRRSGSPSLTWPQPAAASWRLCQEKVSNDLYMHTHRHQQVCRACPTRVGPIQASLLSKNFHNPPPCALWLSARAAFRMLTASFVFLHSDRKAGEQAGDQTDGKLKERWVLWGPTALLSWVVSSPSKSLPSSTYSKPKILSYLGGIGFVPLFTPMRCQCAGAQHVWFIVSVV